MGCQEGKEIPHTTDGRWIEVQTSAEAFEKELKHQAGSPNPRLEVPCPTYTQETELNTEDDRKLWERGLSTAHQIPSTSLDHITGWRCSSVVEHFPSIHRPWTGFPAPKTITQPGW
jgi:hypothetical protein